MLTQRIVRRVRDISWVCIRLAKLMNKLTKNISSIILTASIISFALPVMAQTTSTNAVVPVTSATTTIKVNNGVEDKMQAVRNIAMRLANRFDVNIRVLDSLSSRISSRINKFDQAGKDTTQAKAKLNEANVRIQEAKDALLKMQQGIEAAITSATPKKTFAASKDKLVKGVMDKIKAAHKALVDTIVILVKVSESATTVNSTSTPGAQIANPAAVNCVNKGGKVEIRKDAKGNEGGICVFPDKSECEEWAFFRGECGLTASKVITP